MWVTVVVLPVCCCLKLNFQWKIKLAIFNWNIFRQFVKLLNKNPFKMQYCMWHSARNSWMLLSWLYYSCWNIVHDTQPGKLSMTSYCMYVWVVSLNVHIKWSNRFHLGRFLYAPSSRRSSFIPLTYNVSCMSVYNCMFEVEVICFIKPFVSLWTFQQWPQDFLVVVGIYLSLLFLMYDYFRRGFVSV